MTRFTLYVGLNDKDTKEQITEDFGYYKDVILRTFKKHEIDLTISLCVGVFEGIEENTYKVFSYTENEKAIFSICDELKRVLNQQCILIEKEEINSLFY